MKTHTKAMLTAATLALTASHSIAATQIGGKDTLPGGTIVENAVNSPIHKTLVAAVLAAELAETLSGDGPFTVLAPTDFAFAALPEGTVETLVMPENKDLLTKILTCHVIGTEAMYGAIRGLITGNDGSVMLETLGGCMLEAKMDGHAITVTDENGTVSRVLVPDVMSSNGVIHVINGVILPASAEEGDDSAMEMDESADESAMDGDMSEETAIDEDTTSEDMAQGDMSNTSAEDMGQGDDAGTDSETAMADENTNPMVGGAAMFADRTIVDNAVNSADHTILVDALITAELVDTLSGDGPFTVFAPVDAAFEALPEGTVTTLLLEENRDQLTEILTCHVVGADVMSTALLGLIEAGDGSATVETLGGCALQASVEDGMVKITDGQGGVATVTIADVVQSNGVIHVIDRVLLPAM